MVPGRWRVCCVGLYTILPMPIVSGIYCNNGGSGGNILLRNSVGDDGVGWGAETAGGCAKNSIDSCRKAQKQNNILYGPRCLGCGGMDDAWPVVRLLRWPLHDIANANLVRCMACKWGGRGGVVPNSRAIVLQQCGQCRRAGSERSLVSCTNDEK